jgi:two-component system, sensor histidine kinase and response regulator
VVAENINLHFFSAENKSTQLLNLVDKSITAQLDKSLINLVLRNLISNSVKFTESGCIIVSAYNTADKLYITVQDNGVGMSQENIEKIYQFNERNSVSGTRDEKGTGIGLIICKQFIEKHGGVLRLESERYEGTKAIIELPISKIYPQKNSCHLTKHELEYILS